MQTLTPDAGAATKEMIDAASDQPLDDVAREFYADAYEAMVKRSQKP